MKKIIVLATVLIISTGIANARVVRSRTVSQRTSKNNTEWIVRAGLSINNAAGEATGMLKDAYKAVDSKYSIGAYCGLDVSAAFNKPIGETNFYWGMELGIGSRGASSKISGKEYYYDDYDNEIEDYEIKSKSYVVSKQHISTWNAKFAPITLGYKYSLNNNIKLDGHIGAYVSYDFAGSAIAKWFDDEDGDESEKYKLNDDYLNFRRLDVGMQFGVGVWYKKFNFDITYQRGFIPASKIEGEFDDYEGESFNAYSSNVMLRVGYSF